MRKIGQVFRVIKRRFKSGKNRSSLGIRKIAPKPISMAPEVFCFLETLHTPKAISSICHENTKWVTE